ncbi:MAG: hypothetical protein HY298_07975 [Verrucomicrobia bacterium]|nr:hypothetical protein [Verrucomicrobiota bacterium]
MLTFLWFEVQMNLPFVFLLVACVQRRRIQGLLDAPFLTFITSATWLALAQPAFRTERSASTLYRGKSGKQVRKIFEGFAGANGRELADLCSRLADRHEQRGGLAEACPAALCFIPMLGVRAGPRPS